MNPLASLIPQPIISKLNNDKGLKKIALSINWLFIEKIVFTALTFVVGVLMTRYLGPRKLGRYSYAMSFVALFMPIASLGLDNIAVREFVKRKNEENELMGNVFILKAIGSLLLFVLSILVSLFYNRGDNVMTIFIAILAFGHLFDSFNVIDYWFRAKVEAKYPALSRIFAVSIYSMFKIVLILLKGPLVGFIWATTLNLILQAFFYILFYEKQNGSIFDWEINLKYTKDLLSSAWPLIISGIAVAAYMQIDQIIIRSILGDTELGFYSSAVKISQAGYFIPTIVSDTVFPAIINAKRKSQKIYNKRLSILYGSFLWMSVAIALTISLLSKPLISFLYGAEFLPAAKVLSIHIWAFVFVSLGVASGKQIVAENKTKYMLFRALLGALVSISLNLLLINRYGLTGAAVSQVIAYAFASIISLMFFAESRVFLKSIVSSYNFFRIIKFNFKDE